MSVFIQMLVAHPVVSIWLALTALTWLAVYAVTRKPRDTRRAERRQSA